jgi:hypothetical protein
MTDYRTLFEQMVGDWRGTYRLWLEPEELHSESETAATVSAVFGGRLVAYRYTWSERGADQEGEMLLAAPEGQGLQASWIDSWHNGNGIMFCQPAGGTAVVGEYGTAPEVWRWRTEIDMPSRDALVVTAWNITPAGVEAKATEAIYSRASH